MIPLAASARARSTIRLDAAVVALGTVLILVPALVNGFPFVYPDTGTYLASAFRGAVPLDRPYWYGVFMRLASLGGNTFWGIITAQALLCSVYIFRTVKVLVHGRTHLVASLILLALALTSSVGWYAGQLMPDIFTGIGVLALFHLLLGRGSRWVQVVDGIILVFCCWVHLSNLLILPMSGALLLITHRAALASAARRKWMTLGLLILLAWGGLASANRMVDQRFYISKGGQAFLVARMVDTGMLQAWMEAHCAGGDYRICGYKDRLPPTGVHFLWADSISPMHLEGGWLATRSEYQRIVRSTLTEPRYLLWHMKWSLISTADLLTRWTICRGLVNTEYRSSTSPPYFMIEGTIRSSLPSYLSSMQNGGRGELTMIWPDRIHAVLMVLSLVTAIALIIRFRPVEVGPQYRALLLFVIATLFIDAFVCASLSAVEDRYLSRVTWLLPMAVSIAITRRWPAARTAAGEGGSGTTGTP